MVNWDGEEVAFIVVVRPSVVEEKEGSSGSPSYRKSGDWSVVHEVCWTLMLVREGLKLPLLAKVYSS